jgi:hypothetical protein
MSARRPASAATLQSSPPPPIRLSARPSSRTLRDTYSSSSVSYLPQPSTPLRRPRKGKEPAPRDPSTSRRDRDPSDHSAFASIATPTASKHSHGDSWSSTTRDSVVDNLLMSLDELSMQMNNTFASVRMDSMDQAAEREADKIRQAPLHAAMDITPRARGHTYSSSMSSDFDRRSATAHVSPTNKKYASPSYKSRRSNSSSTFNTFQTAKQTRPLPPTSKYSSSGRGRTDSELEQRRNISTPTRANTGLGHYRDESDNSIADLGYDAVLESSRLAFNGRSISLDQMYTEANNERTASMMSRGRPVPSVHSKFESPLDAAPEPNVAAGPRKKENPSATGPVYVNAAQKQSALRKTTTQSDLRSANNDVPQDVRDLASEFVRDRTASGNMRRKDSSPLREKQGFFKRVFGGSSARSSASEMSHVSDVPFAGRKPSNTPKDAPLTEYSVSVTHAPPAPPALNKKPSSFFRRRKRSISEDAPPALPLNMAADIKAAHMQPSPSISSLREVMDTYLTKTESGSKLRPREAPPSRSISRDSRNDSRNEDSDDLDLFHSGYGPSPDASLGMTSPLSRHATLRSEQGTVSTEDKTKARKRRPEVMMPTASAPELSRMNVVRDGDGSSSAQVSPMTVTHPLDSRTPDKVSPITAKAGESRPVSPISLVSRTSTGDRIIGSGGEVELYQAAPISPADHNSGDSDIHGQSKLTTRDTLHAYDRPGTNTIGHPHLQQPGGEDAVENKTDHAPSNPASQPSPSSSSSMKMPFMTSARTPTEPSTRYHSATSLSLPVVQVDGNDAPRPSVDTVGARERHAASEDDDDVVKQRARRIFEGNEEDVTRMDAAAWLGEPKAYNKQVLDAYMHMFDFAGMNVLSTLRTLCGKLVLKGETQQFDRIITALSSRWCECNPEHGFKAQDVVHTLFYSLILLNTDLHMADIGEKMSKNAYVKNTLPTVRRVVTDAAPNAFEDGAVKGNAGLAPRPTIPWMDSTNSAPVVRDSTALDVLPERTSSELPRPAVNKRMSIRPGMFRAESDGFTPDSPNSSSSNALVSTPWTGSMRAWEFEIETALKSFYSSIKNEPLPLLDLAVADVRPADRNLSVAGNLKRTGSVISKAPSDAASYRSKAAGLRGLSLGWQSRNVRTRPKMYPASTIGSSRTSFDDNSSLYSPAQSSTWSKNSYARTLTSTSVGSLGYHLSPGDAAYKHSIGFANALSQAIIREEGTGNVDEDSVTLKQDLLEDESLTLEGAPWAKEGLVKHKHHLEGPERKSRDRNWTDCFAVIGKGKLTLFNFNTGTTKSYSLGRARLQKTTGGRASSISGSHVGGGDWGENAEQLDSFTLRQTIASTLPPPGYSKTRPHVWALSLPSGAVHLFQVGTPEIAHEWMSTANYWSARLSKEPLSGGVSNIEYGWSEAIINPALLDRPPSAASNFNAPPPSIHNRSRGHTHSSSNGAAGRPSIQSSVRSSFDNMGGGSRHKMQGDKIQITDWQPPSQSMMASQLMEVDQLKSLQAYVANVEAELESHNELKHAIELAVSYCLITCLLKSLILTSESVLVPCFQLLQSHVQLAAQIRISAARNRQVQDLYRVADCCFHRQRDRPRSQSRERRRVGCHQKQCRRRCCCRR